MPGFRYHTLLAGCFAFLTLDALAEARNRIAIEYQYVKQENFYTSDGTKLALGDLTARTLQFDWHHQLNDHWSFSLTVPYVSKRYTGPVAHDPLLLDNPRPNNTFYDNGKWQNAFANIEAGVFRHFSYRDMSFSPFFLLEVPSHNYDEFGLAAPGDGLAKASLGFAIGAPIGLSNFYARGEYMYTLSERAPGGVNVDHHRFQGEFGYFVNPRWTVRTFVLGRYGNGLDFPEDYPSFTDERWYHHDQTMSHEFVNAGVGVEYQLSARYGLSSWTQRIIEGRNSNTTEQALYLQLSIAL